MTAGRASLFALVLALEAGATFMATGMGGCSSTIPAPIAGVDIPPTLDIVSPRDAACVAVPDTTDAIIPVTVDLAGSFILRPPGLACADTYNCGYLRLYVNNQLNNTSATATINANIGTFGERYGTFYLTVELVWDFNDGGIGSDQFDADVTYDGSVPPIRVPVFDASVADPGPTGYYQQTVVVRTAPSCGDAGTTSSSSSSASSGSSSSGGATSGATASSSGSSSGGMGGAGGASSSSASGVSGAGGAGGASSVSDAGGDASGGTGGAGGGASISDAGDAGDAG